MNYLYNKIKVYFSKNDYTLIKQNDYPRHEMIEIFKNSRNPVLFGTDSFWEGVDVQGEQLQSVIIVKLPFKVPNDPVTEAIIENIKERLLTILVTPFMTCSARLPVYSIIIGLIIPDEYFLGFISYKAVMMLIMYIAGFLMALGASFVLKKIIRANEKSYLVMDLPPYKVPMWGNNFRLTMNKVWGFITGSGKIIFSVTVLLWALAFFGPRQNTDQIISADVEMEDSYLAILGKGIEPVVEPLGYDRKIGVGVITSFAARETFVGTMATLYGLEDVDTESEEGELRIMDKMRKDTKPNGEKVFSFATGLSVLMFYAFAMQCISTIAIVYKETRSLKWTLVQMFGMTAIAYLVSFLVYQIFK